MIRNLNNDYAVLRSGYWRIEIDTAHPRFVSMRADAEIAGNYSQEMLTGYGGESTSETNVDKNQSLNLCGIQQGNLLRHKLENITKFLS